MSYTPQQNGVVGFVYRVALNHWRNHRRKTQRLVGGDEILDEHVDEAAERMPIESIQTAQWAGKMRELLADLPELRDRELIVRFYLDQQDKETVCKALGIASSHFNRVTFRARERLRDVLISRGFSHLDILSVGIFLAWIIAGILRHGA